MADTDTQQIQGQQGQQQSATDEILWWEDIFAAIPEAKPETEDLWYEQLDAAYPYEPLPGEDKTSNVSPVPQPQNTQPQVQEAEPSAVPPVQQAPAQEPERETVAMPEPEAIESPREQKLQSDAQKKFWELLDITKKIYDIKGRMGSGEDYFDILGADNDKVYISYRFYLDETYDPMLFITKIEQDKETEEETVNELRFTFNQESSSLEVIVNDTMLFNEVEDFADDQKKKLQVMDKLNKFIFLASEELRKIEKEIKEKEEAEKERRRLQEIFRNF